MCGIIGVVRRSDSLPPAPVGDLAHRLAGVPALLEEMTDAAPATGGASGASSVATTRPSARTLAAAADVLEEVDRALRGVPGAEGLLADPAAADAMRATGADLTSTLAKVESLLEEVDADDLEAVNAALIRCKDGVWAITRDRLRAADGIRRIAPIVPGGAGIAVLLSLHQALSALDRLEVRGRDSAGIEVQLRGHGLDVDDPVVAAALERRADPSFTGGAARIQDGVLVLVHKVAAEIGELGDNTAALRASLFGDELLHRALASQAVEGLVLGHTRWASIGIISEPNAHPQGSDEPGCTGAFATAVLNGDVDNYADLIAAEGLVIPGEITTDAKVIPTLLRRAMGRGLGFDGAFVDTVRRLEGSVAIAAGSTDSPGSLAIALRGSGQALYVGLADDAFIVASEPYGVVEDAETYLRMDGETPSDPANPSGSRGQVILLDGTRAGSVEGIRRLSYDGSELPVGPEDLQIREITTRDIDRGDFTHFLLKEITDSPQSFRATLRGRLVEHDGVMEVRLGPSSLPPALVERLRSGGIRRIAAIGQGTAAIAAESLALHLRGLLAETDVRVEAVLATELSGFGMRADMSDTLAVAISQSGTTTDTNRTVDLIRSRGAAVVSIVNRRGSDLTDKSDGVLYTSDGRDVEMSVASTKAFYAQVAAGLLLSYALAEHVEGALRADDPSEQDLLRALRELPAKLEATLSVRAAAAEAARELAPSRRYWAIVGNGVNRIAAREVRIKLSELCYKSIAVDSTEDKKHIDLSSEPLIFVAAAGLVGSTADDVSKEVAIFRAHKAAPVVVVSEGDRSFDAALRVLTVPQTDPRLAFVLATMAGHLFGYEAALAIDALADPMRALRAAVDEAVAGAGTAADGSVSRAEDLLRRLRPEITRVGSAFASRLADGSLNGHLEAATAVRVSALLRYAAGITPLSGYQIDFGRVGTPGVVLDDLTRALSDAIDELTRPVDAIKHQAKTVTVGISRSDESLLQVPLVAAVLDSGIGRDRLAYSTLRALADLDPAVARVDGFTRYEVLHGDDLPSATLRIIDRGGLGATLRSRVETDPRLRGTKALVAREQELMVARGGSDGRTVLIVPAVRDGVTSGIVLLHVALEEHLPVATARSVLQGYRRRYQALRDAVTETDEMRDELLAEQSVIDLLTVPVLDLVARWRD